MEQLIFGITLRGYYCSRKRTTSVFSLALIIVINSKINLTQKNFDIFKITMKNPQSSLPPSIFTLTWKFMFYVVLTEVWDLQEDHLTHHCHVHSSNKNDRHNKDNGTASVTLFQQFHFFTGGLPKITWKLIERIVLTIFSEAILTCWKRFLRIFQMIQAVNFTFQYF